MMRHIKKIFYLYFLLFLVDSFVEISECIASEKLQDISQHVFAIIFFSIVLAFYLFYFFLLWQTFLVLRKFINVMKSDDSVKESRSFVIAWSFISIIWFFLACTS